MAIEVKASERYLGRLRAGEIVDDILKLEALRIEALNREGSDILPAVVTTDTAPEAKERMTSYPRHEVEAAARERGVCLFYVSPSDEAIERAVWRRATADPDASDEPEESSGGVFEF